MSVHCGSVTADTTPTVGRTPGYKRCVKPGIMQEKPPPPIHALPVEILSSIFLMGFSSGIDPKHPFKRRALEPTTNFEVLVSHVCRHWRNVAFRTPSLWTSIRMRKAAHIERAKEFVKRSRTVPLDVYLDTVAVRDHIPGHTLSVTEFDDAFDAIRPYSARWHSLIIRVNDLECKEAARKHFRLYMPAPALRTLQLWHLQDWGTAQNLSVGTARRPVPIFYNQLLQLQHVSLVGVNLLWPECGYMSGLTHLELALHSEGVRPTGEEWETMLRLSPDLERLSLHYSGPRINSTRPVLPIPLLHLTELSLTDIDIDIVCQLFRQIQMPNVRLLELELADQNVSAGLEWLSYEGHPVFPRLDHLRITALDCETEAWKTFLASSPTISHIEIDFRRVPMDLFEAFLTKLPTPPPNSAAAEPSLGEPEKPFCDIRLPHLQELKIAGMPSIVLTKFIGFREEAGFPIPRCLIHQKVRDAETDALRAATEVEYFIYSDDEGDNDDSDSESDFNELDYDSSDTTDVSEFDEDAATATEDEDAGMVQGVVMAAPKAPGSMIWL